MGYEYMRRNEHEEIKEEKGFYDTPSYNTKPIIGENRHLIRLQGKYELVDFDNIHESQAERIALEFGEKLGITKENIMALYPKGVEVDSKVAKEIEKEKGKGISKQGIEVKPGREESNQEDINNFKQLLTLSEKEGSYPRNISLLTTYLIRNRYLEKVAMNISIDWRSMTDNQLTKYLTKNHSKSQLESMFQEVHNKRNAIKVKFRKYGFIAAIVIGLLWAKDNIKKGEWKMAGAKVGFVGVSAYAFNKALYARDLSAEALIESKG